MSVAKSYTIKSCFVSGSEALELRKEVALRVAQAENTDSSPAEFVW